MRTLAGRTAVVTGAGSGIGRATCELLSSRGVHLAAVDVSADALVALAADLRSTGVRVSTHVVDVSVRDQMLALADDVLDRHHSCHVVVNNAGVTTAGRFAAESHDDRAWLVGINLWGVVHGCEAFLPILLAQEEAHIVNLSSMVGLVGLPQNASYSLTKGGVRSFSEALRAELVTTSVGVTAVFPGAVRTSIMHAARGAEADRLARLAASPLAPVLLRSPDAVARAIVRSVERNRARAVVGLDARALDLAARILPGRSGVVGRAVDRLTR
ncbi:MAG: SDR family NAD(P)-dependent oxidoreductase [Acidimicrobiia bacterium]|nr:SDR family NAD(P)-dependent oxidoreductase [Acidimicrobiia bacterium]